MENNDLTKAFDDEWEKVKNENDPKKLISELSQYFAGTLRHMMCIAARVRRLDEMNYEITLNLPAVDYVRRVAYGQLLPQVFVILQSKESLLKKVSNYQIPDQKKISEDKQIAVMEIGGDYREMPVSAILKDKDLLKQVFSNTGIRDQTEQITWLRHREAQNNSAKNVDASHPETQLDRKRRGIVVKKPGFISAEELAHWLAELSKRGR